MSSSIRRIVWSVLATSLVACPAVGRDLTMADRIHYQRELERVYHEHREGTHKPFEEAVSEELIVAKVHDYLRRSAALEEFWGVTVTAEMLTREVTRIRRDSQMPERLEQLMEALDHDPRLIRECLARPTLTNRALWKRFRPGCMNSAPGTPIFTLGSGRSADVSIASKRPLPWRVKRSRSTA